MFSFSKKYKKFLHIVAFALKSCVTEKCEKGQFWLNNKCTCLGQNRLKLKQLDVYAKGELPCFLYVIQIFACSFKDKITMSTI